MNIEHIKENAVVEVTVYTITGIFTVELVDKAKQLALNCRVKIFANSLVPGIKSESFCVSSISTFSS